MILRCFLRFSLATPLLGRTHPLPIRRADERPAPIHQKSSVPVPVDLSCSYSPHPPTPGLHTITVSFPDDCWLGCPQGETRSAEPQRRRKPQSFRSVRSEWRVASAPRLFAVRDLNLINMTYRSRSSAQRCRYHPCDP